MSDAHIEYEISNCNFGNGFVTITTSETNAFQPIKPSPFPTEIILTSIPVQNIENEVFETSGPCQVDRPINPGQGVNVENLMTETPNQIVQVAEARTATPAQVVYVQSSRTASPAQVQVEAVRTATPAQNLVEVTRTATPAQVVYVQSSRTATPAQVVVEATRTATPAQVQVEAVRTATPAQVVYVQSSRTATPAQVVVEATRTATPAQVQVEAVRTATPAQVVYVQSSRTATPAQVVVEATRTATPAQVQVEAVRTATPAQVVYVQSSRTATPAQVQVEAVRTATPAQVVVEATRTATPAQVVYVQSSRTGTPAQVQVDTVNVGNGLVRGTENLSFETLDDLHSRSLEQVLLQARKPVDIRVNEFITFNGENGLLANKHEIETWRGEIPISQYPINDDSQPDIIRKKTDQHLVYNQEIAIRYLRPPTPPPLGEIVLKEDRNFLPPPAPPLVIRQQPARPETPPPIVIREIPPQPPTPLPPKVVMIPGKKLPPPPRKVVIERLPQLPPKPAPVIIERWLPYKEPARKIVYLKNQVPDPVVEKPKNVVIQWESPEVFVKKDFKDLGVIRANPQDYLNQYGGTLKNSIELPTFVKEIQAPTGVVLAAQHQRSRVPRLEGDIEALKLIDLDREGLSEYKQYLTVESRSRAASTASNTGSSGRIQSLIIGNGSASSSSSTTVTTLTASAIFDAYFLNTFLSNLFASLDTNGDKKISRKEGFEVFSKLNETLGYILSDSELASFVDSFDRNHDGVIDFNEFKNGLLNRFSSQKSTVQVVDREIVSSPKVVQVLQF